MNINHISSSSFGMLISERSSTFGSKSYRYGFNGMEGDDEVKGQGNSLNFGARIYDSRIGRFLSKDRFANQFPFQSSYLFGGNTPIIAIDINGDSLYILCYVNGGGEDMFKASALTRKHDIENSSGFDPARDKVVILEVSNLSDIKDKVETTVKENSDTYGKTAEFGMWSHSGLDGPIGSSPANENDALYNKGDKYSEKDGGGVLLERTTTSTQMKLSSWGNIEFNWVDGGKARAGFYGCNSGNDKRGENQSFTTQLSGQQNFKNVTTLGQTTSSYPSQYVDERNITFSQLTGNYLPFEIETGGEVIPTGVDGYIVTPSKTVIRKTYMVGGDSGESFSAYFGGTNMNPMRSSKNGKSTSTDVSQSGDHKPD